MGQTNFLFVEVPLEYLFSMSGVKNGSCRWYTDRTLTVLERTLIDLEHCTGATVVSLTFSLIIKHSSLWKRRVLAGVQFEPSWQHQCSMS
jgi:hypothetical protein